MENCLFPITRVSNELGAGNPNQAKHAMVVTLKLSILLALAVVVSLALGHNNWAGFFSDSHSIKKKFAEMTPLLIPSIALDAIQGVLSGSKYIQQFTCTCYIFLMYGA